MKRVFLAIASTAFLAVQIGVTAPLSAVPPVFERDGAGAAVDGQTVVQPPQRRQQVVAIIPDRTTGRDWGLRYLKEAVEDFNRTRPDAVFCVGDLVQGYSRSRENVLGERSTFLSIVERLKVPFYPTAGNHDLVSGTRDTNDDSFKDSYRALFGPLYYAVELELASFVVLNSEDGDGRVEAGFSDAQLAWLDATLARLAARELPIVLLFHRPLWDHKPTRWDARVQPLLVRHGVDMVIAGHYHAMQVPPMRDGIRFLVLGTCGGAIDQHPLAGHLQHTTYLVIDASGAIEPYHQIAGTTLPIDWISKVDQDRAFALKSSRDAVTIRGAVPDPLGVRSEGSVEVVLKNPLDRPTTWTFSQTTSPGVWTVLDRDADGAPIERSWVSRTEIDTFNPATTDLKSPFRLTLPGEPIEIPAGGTATVSIAVEADAQAAPPMPAPFELTATFADAKGRSVPIKLRQRLPIARRIALAPSLAAAIEYPIEVWRWSEYDTSERSATARFARGSGESIVDLALTVPDRRLSADAKPGTKRVSLEDPLGDAVRVVLGEGAEAREYLVTFERAGEGDGESGSAPVPVVRMLDATGESLMQTESAWAVFTSTGEAWTLQLSFAEQALPAGARLNDLRVNVGVADNDDTFHTQWRWLAPRGVPAQIRP
jgi:predicted phosphodiesterase